jgi:hypothetical protein
MIAVAHALTIVDSHEEAMAVIRQQSPSVPMVSFAYGNRRPSPEAESWAVLWAGIRTLNPHNYTYRLAVEDARKYLAEHNDEHIAWEQRLEVPDG